MKPAIVVGLFCSMLLVGCGGGGSSSDPQNNGAGAGSLTGLDSCVLPANTQRGLLCGTALAADGATPLIGAEVSFGSSVSFGDSFASPQVGLRGVANSNQCLTDSQGEYSCVLPDGIGGNIEFVITASGFETQSFEANIVAGEVTQAPSQVLNANNSVKWAVVPGLYDGVQVLLSQLKGCTLTDASGADWVITNPDPASARGSIDCESKGLRVLDDGETTFFTDGSLDQFDALFINCDANLIETEINAAIRAFNQNGNDVYFSDLSSPWLTAVFPDRINFAGGATSTQSNFQADVVDASLATVVGDVIDLVFDLPFWTAIDSVSDDTTVYIEGDISEFTDYVGVKPITVGFKPTDTNACVFYTSYHIEGASVGSDQELAIKYLVQNINSVCA